MRLFVGVEPSAEAAAELRRLPRPDVVGVRWLRPEQWHATLRFLGRADPDEVRHAVAGWADGWMAGSTGGLPVAVLGPATEVLGDAVVVVPVVGLDDLAASVVEATAHLGEPPESRPFVGHVTLCRFKEGPPSGLVGRPVAASFPVGEVVLFHSRTLDVGPRTTGVAYEVLDRFPFG